MNAGAVGNDHGSSYQCAINVGILLYLDIRVWPPERSCKFSIVIKNQVAALRLNSEIGSRAAGVYS